MSLRHYSIMEVVPGLRVVRGPDWEYGDQDGGEGYVGTVVGVSQPTDEAGRSVMVQWDGGGKGRYRCGLEDRYELRVFDSAPVGKQGLSYPYFTICVD